MKLSWTTRTSFNIVIVDTRGYSPLRELTSSSCGGLRPSAEAFFALRGKKELIILFWTTFGNFWCPVVTLVTFSSNISNNNQKKKKIQKKSKKIKKIQKIQKSKKRPKNQKNPKKIQKIQKKPKKSQKIQKIHKKLKKSKNCQKWSKNPNI